MTPEQTLSVIEEHKRLVDEILHLKREIHSLCLDWAEAHTYAQNVAKRYLPESTVEGDSYGVPGIEELVDMLVALIPEEKRISSSVKGQSE